MSQMGGVKGLGTPGPPPPALCPASEGRLLEAGVWLRQGRERGRRQEFLSWRPETWFLLVTEQLQAWESSSTPVSLSFLVCKVVLVVSMGPACLRGLTQNQTRWSPTLKLWQLQQHVCPPRKGALPVCALPGPRRSWDAASLPLDRCWLGEARRWCRTVTGQVGPPHPCAS